jgi:hypothetical protein
MYGAGPNRPREGGKGRNGEGVAKATADRRESFGRSLGSPGKESEAERRRRRPVIFKGLYDLRGGRRV